MGFLDLSEMNLEDAMRPKPVEAGEYTLTLEGFRKVNGSEEIFHTTEKMEGKYFNPIYSIDHGEPDFIAARVSGFVRVPEAGMSLEEMNKAKLSLKEFLQAHGEDISGGLDLDTLVGTTCDAVLVLKESDEYGAQNDVKHYVTSA